MAEVKSSTTVECPHCRRLQEDVAVDFTIQGRVRIDSKASSECIWCDRWFDVENNGDGTCEVTAI